MGFEFWIWLIIIVISLIARARRKKNVEVPTDKGFNKPDPSDGTKPLTFEELLREIQQSKTATEAKPKPLRTKPKPTFTERKPFVQPEPSKPQYTDYDDDIKEEEQDLEDASYDYRDKDTIYNTYEKAKNEAFLRPSLEETSNVDDTDMRWKRFDEFTEKKAKPSFGFVKELRDPKGFKKAFIMSEILNRKY